MNKPQTTPLSESSSIVYYEEFLNRAQADELMRFCTHELTWEQSEITLYGKRVLIPRLNAWLGDASYSYSGTRFEAQKIPQPLQVLQNSIATESHLAFNSLLANLYRDGNDCMGWHSDDERSLGSCPQIASLSLGAPRRFVLRKKGEHSNKKEVLLHHGSLLLMRGSCQSEWQHSLPRMRRVTQARINLTFRNSETQ